MQVSDFYDLSTEPGSMQCLAEVIDTIGTPAFSDNLARLVRLNSPFDRLFISALFPKGPPGFLSRNVPYRTDATPMAPYLEVSFLLDPFYQMYLGGVTTGVFRLGDCVPDDFFAGEYYREYYQPVGIVDECAILVPSVDGASIFLSASRKNADRPVQEGDTDRLQMLFPVLKSLCQRHWPALSASDMEGTGRVRAHMQAAFQNFGSEVLTARERQVVNLILQGHSSKSLSERLGISLQTVKNHRKSIHVKLGITTQGELFSTFLEVLTSSPVGFTGDPLRSYLRAGADR